MRWQKPQGIVYKHQSRWHHIPMLRDSSGPKRFRFSQAPIIKIIEKAAPPEPRKSARERGYDVLWDRQSQSYRRKNPFCEECRRKGRLGILADLVDHIIPVRHAPELIHDWKNFQSLCKNLCHDRWKRELEEYAEKTGQIDKLTDWVRRPETRPDRFRIVRR